MVLMTQREHIIWSPCAACCLNIMVEDIEKEEYRRGHKKRKKKKEQPTSYRVPTYFILMKSYTGGHEIL